MACSFGISSIACGDENIVGDMKSAYDIPQDYCRTYYEVFVRSFADGDGDGIGDLRGLIDNLDYLNDGNEKTDSDLGINGIWMMPINKASSYHKYDVVDYYDIDDEYGTLEDFKELVEECNKRDIWLQMDLVLNHTSDEHPWFEAALAAARNGEEPDSEDMSKYVFVHESDKPNTGTWHKVQNTDYWYLGNFNNNMPDLNLQNQSVRDEIKDIVDYWLELGIKSFRLDAVPWACANSVSFGADNKEFWTWFNDYCNTKGAEVAAEQGWADDSIDRYCYNVGEVLEMSGIVSTAFYETGMTNFNFSLSTTSDYGYAGVVNGYSSRGGWGLAADVEELQADARDAADSDTALLANVLSNHDQDRISGLLGYNATKIKKTAGLYLLMPGNPYIYYGEEIGAAGSGEDPSKRLPFNWGDKRDGIEEPPGADYSGKQPLGTLKSQRNKSGSVWSYYRDAIKLRNRFPEIGRGTMTAYAIGKNNKLKKQSDFEDDPDEENSKNLKIVVYTLTWGDRQVLIAQNVSGSTVSFNLSSEFKGYKIVGQLKANGGDVLLNSENTLTLSGGGVAVLKK